MICPHCKASFEVQLGVEFGGQKGAISGSDLDPKAGSEQTGSDQRIPPKLPRRGRARDYTQLFETAWKLYGRKEEKGQAFMAWLVASGEVGGEDQLLSLVITGLRWQGPNWGLEGWRFAPYFERYLKKRRWEDEPLPIPTGAPRANGLAPARPAPYHAPAKPIAGLREWAKGDK